MSIAALNWAWDQTDLSSSAKLVLVALADRANDDGKCWPGMDKVAERACMSTRQVSRHLTTLEDMGLLSRRRLRRDDGTLGRYVYRLNMAQPTLMSPPDTDDQWSDATSGHSGSSPPDTEGVDHRTSVSGQEATQTTATHSEPKEEPSDDNFEQFWGDFPRGQAGKPGGDGSKKRAKQRWDNMTGPQQQLALAAVGNYAAHVESPDGPWACHASTWLNQDRWEQWQKPAERAPPDDGVSTFDGPRDLSRSAS